MPAPQIRLPHPLETRPFSVAEAQRLGITHTTLEHQRFARPYHGVRALTEKDHPSASTTFDRTITAARDLVPRLRPSERFSHSTALLLLGCPIRAAPAPHVTILSPGKPSRARGVVGHQADRLGAVEFTKSGLPVVSAGEAFIQAASMLSFRELVIAADHLILPGGRSNEFPPRVPLEDLRRIVAASSARGSRRARAALCFVRVGSASRMETILRLIIAEYGLDVFDLQVHVTDAQGRWIGRFDLVNLARRLIVEYDGEQHRTSNAQYEHDQERIERARAAGFEVLRFRKRQVLGDPVGTARRIASALGMPLRPVRGEFARLFAERGAPNSSK